MEGLPDDHESKVRVFMYAPKSLWYKCGAHMIVGKSGHGVERPRPPSLPQSLSRIRSSVRFVHELVSMTSASAGYAAGTEEHAHAAGHKWASRGEATGERRYC